MDPCVYTTLSETWLRAASVRGSTESVCFRSGQRWATAARLLTRAGTLAILFRQQDEPGDVLRCRFSAKLVEINFRDQFATDSEALAWLDQKLWLQRETIKKLERTDSFPTWESQYKAWEVDKFMPAETWYIVQDLREIRPLPLPRLRKLSDNRPLSPNFVRGYALCHFPSEEVVRLGDRVTV